MDIRGVELEIRGVNVEMTIGCVEHFSIREFSVYPGLLYPGYTVYVCVYIMGKRASWHVSVSRYNMRV